MTRILCILLPCLLLFSVVQAQNISTFAGKGSGANSGDGGPATAAVINYPCYAKFDKNGNLYIVTGVTGKTVRKINTAGIISTIAGISGSGGYTGDGGPATNAKFGNPQGVTVDTVGNVYVSDAQYNVVRKIIVATGFITTVAGNGAGTYSGDGVIATNTALNDPNGICFDGSGNLYIADYGNSRIRKVNTLGIISTFAGTGINGYNGDGGLADTSQIRGAFDVCSDLAGNIYIADEVNGRIRKVDPAGFIYTVAGNGVAAFSGDGLPATDAEVQPHSVTIDKFGNIYMLDQPRNKIRVINTMGVISTVAGNGVAGFLGDGSPATAAELNNDFGLTTDTCGNLYISEVGNFRIRKVTFDTACGDGFVKTALNIGLVTLGNISFYPNPTNTSFEVSSNSRIKQISIINLQGQIVFDQVYDIEKAEVNVSGLSPGVYIVKVTDIDGRKTITKIIKR